MLIVSALSMGCAATGSTTSDPAGCIVPSDPPTTKMTSAGLAEETSEAKSTIAWLRFDASAIAVGICGTEATSSSLGLGDGDRTLSPNGGWSSLGAKPVVVAFFPPTTSRRLTLLLHDTVVAMADLPIVAESSCPISLISPDRIDVLSCGALVRLRWDTGIELASPVTGIVNLQVSDPETGDHRGFFLERTDTSSGRLSIDFATDRPSNSRLRFEILGLYDSDGREVPIPKAMAEVTVRGS